MERQHGAATSNQKSIIQYLVESGARLDARNKLGWTPLMVAEGGQFGATVKEFPEAAAFIRKLMITFRTSTWLRPETRAHARRS
jgi:hypothetical protein